MSVPPNSPGDGRLQRSHVVPATMPVLHSRADRLTRVHTLLERNMSDEEVLYLGTVNRCRVLDEASCVGDSTIRKSAGG